MQKLCILYRLAVLCLHVPQNTWLSEVASTGKSSDETGCNLYHTDDMSQMLICSLKCVGPRLTDVMHALTVLGTVRSTNKPGSEACRS